MWFAPCVGRSDAELSGCGLVGFCCALVKGAVADG